MRGLKDLCRAMLLLCSAMFLMANLGGMAHGKGTDSEDLKKCTANLKRIYELIVVNEHHSAGLVAPDFQTIYLLSRKPDMFVCPSDKHPDKDKDTQVMTSYQFINHTGNPRSSSTPARTLALVIETRPNHDGTRLVLFGDGSIVRFADAEFDKLRKRGFVRN